MGDAQANDIYSALMAVKPPELSPNAWAVKAGVNRAVWVDMRRSGNPTRRTVEKLLEAIGMTPAAFEARQGTVQSEVRGTGMSPAEVREAWALPHPAKRVPILGTAFGSDLEGLDDIETTELMMSEVLDYVARPPSLAGDEEAYAVTTIGDSMSPRFEPGEIVFVSPKATVGIGDDVVVQLRGVDDGDQLAERVTTVLLKRLVKRTARAIELKQFNPEKTFSVPIERVRRIHRVRGRL